jgi:methionyl-tRNA formyltransferase
MNIYVLSTVEVGTDIINVLKNQLNINGIIGLKNQESSDDISGYYYMENYCKANSIPFIEVQNYSLKSEVDKTLLQSLNIDILIVAGWQRLIPQWLITQCKICVIGGHGSPYGIAGGRGRSPQNWSIILNKKEFFISIFKIDEGIDSGDIIDEKEFEISPFDDIESSYNKVCWLTSQMIIDCIQSKKITSGKLIAQDANPRYFPQRLPEDGQIDWNRTDTDIYNFIRALTKPYPGAFSYLNGGKLIVWSAKPFAVFTTKKYSPGQIVKKYTNGKLLVSTLNGFVQIDNYTFKSSSEKETVSIEEGMMLESADFKQQMKNIVDRHEKKYPELKIAEDILSLTK